MNTYILFKIIAHSDSTNVDICPKAGHKASKGILKMS